MTESDRERLVRASQHPLYQAALRREPNDYFWPALLLGLFYLLVPMLFLLPMTLAAHAADEMAVMAIAITIQSIWAVPFIWFAFRALRLHRLPSRHVFGLITGRARDRRPGTWVTVEPLDGAPVDLRLRLKAYLESTGGAVGTGAVGVALCRGDQMVEWVDIPESAPVEAAGTPEPPAADQPADEPADDPADDDPPAADARPTDEPN